MKNLVLVALLFVSTLVSAQKYAFVDSEYILRNIPAYEAANEQLNQLSGKWQKEIEARFEEVSQLYQAYQTENVFLSSEMKVKRENEIVEKEKEAKQLQQSYFGQNGELFKRRESLIKPIQDDIFNAITEIAADNNYLAVFDKASGMGIMYVDPKQDISDDVLVKLGYKNE
ncbi:OmpH family outer membrane protein [Carboxylicivirga caseinilyticus]|uniref:OmpH family outer membrane protein n=1 Tax=Carboxylicivirga caseinilyticus TaxID=3417572 RepID=UPI002AA6CF8B|nr:OmpH family outer membrane protein [uncultured Carboxylicivirga sp.]MCU4163383.1 OmpH family outer membrane protein [Marinilabiliaceae bacterium A049]